METFVTAIFFGLAAAMGLVMVMAPSFVWFHLLKMQWPSAFASSPLRMTLWCTPLTLLVGTALTWQTPDDFSQLSQGWLAAAVGSGLLQTPAFLYWQYRRNKR